MMSVDSEMQDIPVLDRQPIWPKQTAFFWPLSSHEQRRKSRNGSACQQKII